MDKRRDETGDPSEASSAPDAGEGNPTDGYLLALPTFLPAGLTVTAGVASILPWGAEAFAGMLGTAPNDPSSPILVVSSEWPISWLRTVEPLSKFDREVIYLRRYSADQALATGGVHAFANVEPGADPPDTQVTTDQGVIGVESTTLTLEDRRGAHGLFLQLRRRLLEQEPAVFAKLVHHAIYVWFEAPDAPGLAKPHRRSDDEAVSELIRELAEYEPNSQQLRVPSTMSVGDKAPPLPLATTTAGARFYAFPFLGSVPNSMLYTIAGFDVGLVHTTLLTAQAAWDEVQRLVDSHDQPGVDFLLITAGAPDQRGTIFPAEQAVADFLIRHPIGLSRPPTHIKQIVLHTWMTGQATLIHPSISPQFGPLYQGLTPSHHPIRSVPGDGAAEATEDAETSA